MAPSRHHFITRSGKTAQQALCIPSRNARLLCFLFLHMLQLCVVSQACHIEGGSAGLIPSQLLEEKRKAFVKRDMELATTGRSASNYTYLTQISSCTNSQITRTSVLCRTQVLHQALVFLLPLLRDPFTEYESLWRAWKERRQLETICRLLGCRIWRLQTALAEKEHWLRSSDKTPVNKTLINNDLLSYTTWSEQSLYVFTSTCSMESRRQQLNRWRGRASWLPLTNGGEDNPTLLSLEAVCWHIFPSFLKLFICSQKHT